jgi:hypothetical protein
MKRCLYAIALLVLSCFNIDADVPIRTEELIFTINAFNGMNFSRTYARENADTIYLLADTNNFMHLRKTLVYFWPLTGKWLTDLDRLDQPFDGILEIEKSGKLIKKLGADVFLYYNEPGELENNWKVFTGENATKESERIETLETEFNKRMADYSEKYEMYENVKKTFIYRMEEYTRDGKDTSDLLARFKQLVEPAKPKSPPYQELTGGKEFNINLPKGVYTIKLRNSEGLVLEGSEKKLIVFDERREESIGYDIVPSDKWTLPMKSTTPANVIYIDGTTDLYILPFEQKEYNDLAYDKLLDNSSKGNPFIFRWEKIREVTGSRIEKTTGNESEVILEKKYFVSPMQSGAILGYKIEPYDPEGAHKNKNYSFKGFHIPVTRNERLIVIKLQDQKSAYYPLSERVIRIVIKSNWWMVLVFFILVPLIVMTIVLVARSRVYVRVSADTHTTVD